MVVQRICDFLQCRRAVYPRLITDVVNLAVRNAVGFQMINPVFSEHGLVFIHRSSTNLATNVDV